MWNTLDSHSLNAMLLLGDNVYIDYPANPLAGGYMALCYPLKQDDRSVLYLTPGTMNDVPAPDDKLLFAPLPT